MNKLWVFGDSYSEPFSKINNQWRQDYIDWKGYTPKCYSEIISEKLKLKLVNLSIGGADNYTIFESIIPFLNNIQQNDIIIFGWSHTLRFRIVNKMGKFNTIRPSSLETVFELNRKSPYLDFSDNTIKEIIINRNNNLYINEINNYIKLINFTFKNNKIIHWSPFRQDTEGLLTTRPTIKGLELILTETNGIVDDTHFSENAHKLLSNNFIDIINNYTFDVIKNTLI